jgi:hypothetical protein
MINYIFAAIKRQNKIFICLVHLPIGDENFNDNIVLRRCENYKKTKDKNIKN